MQYLHNYLFSLTAAALLTAICQAMMPAGAVKRVSSFTCALVLFVVTVRPILQTDYGALLSRWEEAYTALAVYDPAMEEQNTFLTQQLITRRTAAYIEAKAEEQGIHCTAVIGCRMEEGLPVPDRVTWQGKADLHCQSILTELTERELGIPPEHIDFTEGG